MAAPESFRFALAAGVHVTLMPVIVQDVLRLAWTADFQVPDVAYWDRPSVDRASISAPVRTRFQISTSSKMALQYCGVPATHRHRLKSVVPPFTFAAEDFQTPST